MRSQSETLAGSGVGGRFNWLVGGAVGGLVGAALFGVFLWLVEPAIVTEAIPELYGLEGGGLTAWAFHLVHGVVLGTVFAFLITRDPIMGTLTADVETPVIDTMGPTLRIVAAGLVYGLILWVIFPGLVLTALVTTGDTADTQPWASIFNLVGHLLYGMLLGGLVSLFTDFRAEAEASDDPFEEASE